jgi:hypothetical protein
MTQRTQITLGSDEHRQARRRAADQGISLAEYIRRLVRDDLAGTSLRGDVTALFALGDSGGANVAKAKDDYVGEAVSAAHRR